MGEEHNDALQKSDGFVSFKNGKRDGCCMLENRDNDGDMDVDGQ